MIEPFIGTHPTLADDAWVAPTAAVIGDVTLGRGVSIWYAASLRGDVNYIRIGDGSNVQDCATVHVSRGTHPCVLGQQVTIGHNAVVHGCTVEDGCLIGMAAVVLDGAVIGAGSTVGAKALVTGNTIIPPRSLVLGAPAKVVRELTDAEVEANLANARHYVGMTRIYAGAESPTTNPYYDRERDSGGDIDAG
jgi:carbonic anhydrase/acetyltransferase-like protein (isoleucine patch superfamily)